MTLTRKIILWVGTAVFVIAALCPPTVHGSDFGGFAWFWQMPYHIVSNNPWLAAGLKAGFYRDRATALADIGNTDSWAAHVNYTLYHIELALIVLVTAVAFATSGKSPKA